MPIIKAISIQQPWAWCIIHAGKDIENRDWLTKVRGQVLIHAGKKIDHSAFGFIKSKYGIEVPNVNDLPTGGIVGSVEIVNCVRQSTSKWFFGKFGFVLKNAKEIPLIPLQGRLGFFDVSCVTVP